jgi:hypothetical protein
MLLNLNNNNVFYLEHNVFYLEVNVIYPELQVFCKMSLTNVQREECILQDIIVIFSRHITMPHGNNVFYLDKNVF